MPRKIVVLRTLVSRHEACCVCCDLFLTRCRKMRPYLMKFALMTMCLLAVAPIALAQTQIATPIDPTDTRIPRNSKVYIAPAHGFEQYLAAAFRKKSVPLLIVADRDAADFEITATHDKESANWARIYVWGLLQGTASASIQIVNLKTKVVVFADSSERLVALRGERSTAEKLAKYLKRRMEKDEKKSRARADVKEGARF